MSHGWSKVDRDEGSWFGARCDRAIGTQLRRVA